MHWISARPEWGAVLLLGFAALAVIAPTAGAAESERLPPDARSRGMGCVHTAIAGGAAAPWWNPAALGLMGRISLMPSSSSTLTPDLEHGIEVSRIGMAGGGRRAGVGILRTRITYPAQAAFDFSGQVVGEFQPYERTVVLGLGAEILHAYGIDTRRFRLGLGFSYKQVKVDLAPARVTRDGVPVAGEVTDFDVGLLFTYRPTGRDTASASRRAGSGRRPQLDFRIGFVVANLRDQGLPMLDLDDPDFLGRRLRVGGAVDARWGERSRFDHLVRVIIGADHTSFQGRAGDATGQRTGITSVGAEVSLLGLCAWRNGYIHDPAGDLEAWTWGFGLGADLPFGTAARLGGRFDVAGVPRSGDTGEDIRHHTLSLWGTF